MDIALWESKIEFTVGGMKKVLILILMDIALWDSEGDCLSNFKHVS